MKRAEVERDARAELVKEAWVGDAVLSLYVRLKILRDDGVLDGPKSVRMTSNQFLGSIGEPTKVEAEIGRVYSRDGLDAAFRLIEERVMPVFEKQEAKRFRNIAR
jgi:hypothetical protein